MRLENKIALVTGGGQGIGKEIAKTLALNGAFVLINYIDLGNNQEIAQMTKNEIESLGGKCEILPANVASYDETLEMFKTIKNEYGRLDILINNAGIQRRHKCEEFPLSDWEAVLQVNLNTVFMLCQLAGNVMLKQGHGKIINLASMLSFFGGYTVPAYAASKGAVAQLTKALANEWANKNINVNAIAPGYMNTEMNVNLVNDTNRNQEILNRIPAGRWGTPNDMKGLAIFLSSSASNYINGAIIPVDGGYLSR